MLFDKLNNILFEKKTVWEYHEKQNKTKLGALFLFKFFCIHVKLISIFHIQKYQPKNIYESNYPYQLTHWQFELFTVHRLFRRIDDNIFRQIDTHLSQREENTRSCHFHVATRSLSPLHLKQGSCRLPSIRHSDETCISCTLQLLIFVNVVWTMPKHARFQLKPERASEVQSYKNWETYDKTLLRPLLVFFLSLQPQRTEREWVKCSSLYYQWSIPQRKWFTLLYFKSQYVL